MYDSHFLAAAAVYFSNSMIADIFYATFIYLYINNKVFNAFFIEMSLTF